MEKKAKIAWLYLIAALFVAVGLFFVVKKNTYLFFALPVVLGVLLLYIFSLDKVLLLTAFAVPLSVNLKALEAGLAISLPAEPLHPTNRATDHPIIGIQHGQTASRKEDAPLAGCPVDRMIDAQMAASHQLPRTNGRKSQVES